MRHLLNIMRNRRLKALPLALGLTIALSACMPTMEEALSSTGMTAKNTEDTSKKVAAAEQAEKKAHEEEAKAHEKEKVELKKEREEEKAEDKDYLAMKAQLERDKAEAEAHPEEVKTVSRIFFDEEILAVNERLHHLSERVKDLSERVHGLTERLESVPTKLAELELALDKTEEKLGIISARPTAPSKPAKKASTPKQLVAAPKKSFWGVQLGAYRTRAGAEVSWGEFLANPLAVELTEATVHYVTSRPNKKGHTFTLIVVNEYPNRKSANKACNALKENGLDCVAYRVKQ